MWPYTNLWYQNWRSRCLTHQQHFFHALFIIILIKTSVIMSFHGFPTRSFWQRCFINASCSSSWLERVAVCSSLTQCTAKCGRKAQVSRDVRCSDETRPCDPMTKPANIKNCTGPPCERHWTVSEWGPVSVFSVSPCMSDNACMLSNHHQVAVAVAHLSALNGENLSFFFGFKKTVCPSCFYFSEKLLQCEFVICV